MMCGMNKAKIVKSWASLGDARPSYDEYERAMTRPVRMNRYGFVDAMEILDWVFREDLCSEYFRLRHWLCSLRVAKLKAAERRPRYYAAENERRRALAAERRRFGWTLEDVETVLRPMAETGHEPVGAMGNDAALECLRGDPLREHA